MDGGYQMIIWCITQLMCKKCLLFWAHTSSLTFPTLVPEFTFNWISVLDQQNNTQKLCLVFGCKVDLSSIPYLRNTKCTHLRCHNDNLETYFMTDEIVFLCEFSILSTLLVFTSLPLPLCSHYVVIIEQGGILIDKRAFNETPKISDFGC